MLRKSLRIALVLGALASASSLIGSGTAEAAHPDIFYNFYNGPTVFGVGTPAQLYVSPRPTPPLVGHTYNTYPPLMPHEFLYKHHRTYYKYYHHGGYTSSHVRYHTGKVAPFIMRNTFGLF